MILGKIWPVVLFGTAGLLACGQNRDKSQQGGKELDFSSKRNPGSEEPMHEVPHHIKKGLSPGDAEDYQHDPWYRPVDFSVTHYNIDIKVDPVSGLIHGTSGIRFRSLADDLRTLSLDAKNMNIQGVTDQAGRSLTFSYEGQVIYIELVNSLAAGKESGVSVSYEASRSQSLFLTGPDTTSPERMQAAYTYTQPDGSQEWYPCLDRPEAKAPADIRIAVPKPFRALSNGVMFSQTGDAQQSVFSYRMEQPVAPYLISLAVGTYDVVSLGSYQGKALSLWAPPAILDKARFDTLKTKDMMASFGRFTGVEYPYASYAQSVAQAWGSSMEHQAATTMGGWRIRGDRSGEGVVAHELAHQWFGDWVTCESWSELWLNEGFASYLPTVWFRNSAQMNQSLDYEIWFRQGYFAEAKTSPRALSTETVVLSDMFDSHAYEKGALVIGLMRHIANSMPPASATEENFTLALRDYLSRKGGQNVRNTDLQESLERITGRSWMTFFSQWVRSPGHPRLTLSWSKGLRPVITVTQTQKRQENPWRLFTFPLEMELLGKNGERSLQTLRVYDEKQSFTLEPGFEVIAISPDPSWHLPAEFSMPEERQNWQTVLEKSPEVRSRLTALRQIFAPEDSLASPALLKILAKDPALFVPTESLSLMSKNPSNYQAIRQLMADIRGRSADPDYDRSVSAALALTEVWLTSKNQDSITEQDAEFWKQSYPLAGSTWEREALIKKLVLWDTEKTQEFALTQLQNPGWVTKDRAVLIDVLSQQLNPVSVRFLKTAIPEASAYWARRIINTLIRDSLRHPELIEPLLYAARYRRYTSTRITAVRALGSYTDHKALVCPALKSLGEDTADSQGETLRVHKAVKAELSRLNCSV